MDFSFNLDNKLILITGAGSGIGRQTAITLSQLGAQLILLDISAESLADTEALLTGTHKTYCADISDEQRLADISDEVATLGQLSGLVHCAGISSRKPLRTLTTSGFEPVMTVNFYGFVSLVKLFTKRNRMADGGSIVVMSSISSTRGYKAKTEYCVSKASVDAFVRCSALELAPKGIRINSIAPGEVLTPMAQRARELAAAAGAPLAEQPLGPTHPQEVANLIAFLLSDLTRTITGTSSRIDGGACI